MKHKKNYHLLTGYLTETAKLINPDFTKGSNDKVKNVQRGAVGFALFAGDIDHHEYDKLIKEYKINIKEGL